jgi:hypothetical protein
VVVGEQTLAALERVVGPDHPYTLIARLNLANACGVSGDLPSSEALGRAALAAISERYGPLHPDAVVCASNLAVTLHEQRNGQGEEEAQTLRARAMEELIDQLGATHQAARACRRWQRLGRSLEVLPT